jgi:hypothetical protein
MGQHNLGGSATAPSIYVVEFGDLPYPVIQIANKSTYRNILYNISGIQIANRSTYRNILYNISGRATARVCREVQRELLYLGIYFCIMRTNEKHVELLKIFGSAIVQYS